MKIILEINPAKMIKTGWESTGHGAFGEPEGTNYDYIVVNGKQEKIYDRDKKYIIHDGANVLGSGYVEYLPTNLRKHLDPETEKKEKQDRYEKYLELKKEFEK